MKPTRVEIDEVTRLVRRTLVSYNLKPSNEAVADLTRRLVEHGQRYVVRARKLDGVAPRVTNALADWDIETAAGPPPGPLGNWDHARSLARHVRTLHNALLEEGRRREAVGQRQADV
ncbi:DUF6415 family natural product biosynthesis protein [Streptomyces sp. IBSNAI002]|uniref:DUF6415 family natural product biosynthesis protein n=1 Tax=Streptomyces sp. IBSNAI002 TaxID=3457500 RepID=UPI003FD64E22